jgi:hypothetical protein
MVRFLFSSAAGTRTDDIKPLLVAADAPVTQEWTKLEVVFEVPVGANKVTFGLFSWGINGGIWVDDVECEMVPDTTPLTSYKR